MNAILRQLLSRQHVVALVNTGTPFTSSLPKFSSHQILWLELCDAVALPLANLISRPTHPPPPPPHPITTEQGQRNCEKLGALTIAHSAKWNYGHSTCPVNRISRTMQWRITQFYCCFSARKIFYKTRRFITALTTACRLSLSSARTIQFRSFQSISLGSILILSFHLRLSRLSGFFPLGFPTKILFAPLSCSPYVAHAPLNYWQYR